MAARIAGMEPADRNITLKEIGERGWLSILENKLGKKISGNLLVPIGDDAAVFHFPQEKKLVITTDAMVEGTHFYRHWLGWRGLAARAVLAAASDITAMGGIPLGFTISLGVPGDVLARDLEQFADGLLETAEQYGLDILGGDTVGSPHLFVDVGVIGGAAESRILRQQGACAGDALWVTGTLGHSHAALIKAQLLDEGKADLDDPCWRPPDRWGGLEAIRCALPLRAMTDLSDGLARDLGKILRNKPIDAMIELDHIPVDPFTREVASKLGRDPAELAYIGGEDYELLLVEAGDSFQQTELKTEGMALHRIGKIHPGAGKVHLLREGESVRITDPLFEHFRT